MLAQNGCLKIRNLKRSNQQKLFRIIIILKLPILFEKLFQHFSNFQSASHNVLYLSIRHSLKKDDFRFKASKKSALFEITELRSQLEPLYSRSFYLKRIKPPPPPPLPPFLLYPMWVMSIIKVFKFYSLSRWSARYKNVLWIKSFYSCNLFHSLDRKGRKVGGRGEAG